MCSSCGCTWTRLKPHIWLRSRVRLKINHWRSSPGPSLQSSRVSTSTDTAAYSLITRSYCKRRVRSHANGPVQVARNSKVESSLLYALCVSLPIMPRCVGALYSPRTTKTSPRRRRQRPRRRVDGALDRKTCEGRASAGRARHRRAQAGVIRRRGEKTRRERRRRHKICAAGPRRRREPRKSRRGAIVGRPHGRPVPAADGPDPAESMY